MLRSYAKGAASYILPAARNSHADLFPVSAEFSYSQFLRHLTLRSEVRPFRFGEAVAEFGPGSSLGFGLAALIAGARHYQTHDVAAHFDVETNLRVFDRLATLFGERRDIPHDGEFVRLFPYVDDHAFPALLSEDWMSEALAPARLARIRAEILAGGGDMIKVSVGAQGALAEGRVDWIASHSVLEHVDDLEPMYALFDRLLAPDGVMTHLIDFSSHGLTGAWNGHWALGELQWTILRGRRTYLINRQPLERHRTLLARHRFAATTTRLHRRVDGFLKASFKAPFDAMSSLDASTHMAFLVVEKLGG